MVKRSRAYKNNNNLTTNEKNNNIDSHNFFRLSAAGASHQDICSKDSIGMLFTDLPIQPSERLKKKLTSQKSFNTDDGTSLAEERRRKIWETGLRLLQSAGRSQHQARVMIGKWVKGLDTETLLSILEEATRKGVLDPIAYCSKAVINAREGLRQNADDCYESYSGSKKNWNTIRQRETMFIP